MPKSGGTANRTLGIIGIFIVGIALGIVVNTFSPLSLTSLLGGDISRESDRMQVLRL